MAAFSLRHPFRSIGRILRDIVGRPERRAPPEPIPVPPPEPPPRPPIDYVPSNYDYDATRAEIFNDVTDTSGLSVNARDYWDLFSDTGLPTGLDYDSTNEAWDEFLRAFWLNSTEAGSIRRETFYNDWDLSRELIDWDAWREYKKTP